MVSKCFRLREARYISSPTCQCTQAQEQTVMVSTHTRADCVHGGLRAVSQHARAVSTNADAMQVCAPGSPPSPCGFAREAAAGQAVGRGEWGGRGRRHLAVNEECGFLVPAAALQSFDQRLGLALRGTACALGHEALATGQGGRKSPVHRTGNCFTRTCLLRSRWNSLLNREGITSTALVQKRRGLAFRVRRAACGVPCAPG